MQPTSQFLPGKGAKLCYHRIYDGEAADRNNMKCDPLFANDCYMLMTWKWTVIDTNDIGNS